ncbi:GNAT family N-acetyltransferase [Pontibacillus yanchengensis]|uniref:GNAT family N-acetyltransferase n=1 Tax=Pontibacillus yanchengensis TaxID=462910 RepID=A0A6I5A0Q6_9BACI|nr:GNAT family N-acetyltransferase [Pontibacillus yanchengensis]MYL34040.1 GNAT family N-acetyltransferase [Pontibacillus yanchengensis]
MSSIALALYNERYYKQLENYNLPEEMVHFTDSPLPAIHKSKQDQERFPVVIVYDEVPVGFFVLHGWNGVQTYSDNKQALLVRGFSIDSGYQGNGIATKSMQLLPRFVKEYFPGKDEILLAVNHKNRQAQHVYMKSGFIDKGKRIMGPKGELHLYHLDITL